MQTRPALKQWPPLFDVSAQPGGWPLFAYTCLCGPCAAGDSAQHSGGSYWASCLGPLVCPWCGLCIRCADRKRMAMKHAVQVEPTLILTAVLCCLGPCALRQELVLETELQNQVDPFKGGICVVSPLQNTMGEAPAALVNSVKETINGLIN